VSSLHWRECRGSSAKRPRPTLLGPSSVTCKVT
jgi:hypothetical protein